MTPTEDQPPLRAIALLFTRLGATSFGGPAAHVAMMEDEVVRRRGWLSREEFLDFLGATNLIPGPNSTELAIHIGRSRAGWPGLVVAGVAFILPAVLIVSAAAWAYVAYGTLPAVAGVMYGVKPVAIAIVAQALWRLGRTALRGRERWIIGIAATVAAAAGVHELAILGVAGACAPAAAAVVRRARTHAASAVAVGVLSAGTSAAGAASAATPFAIGPLFLVFIKAGALLFGSGYVLLAFLRADLVERLGWLTEAQLIDAIAIGQVTPGPVFTSATFIGYVLGGPLGAAVATIGIFLPAFVFVALSGSLVPRMRRSPAAGAVLDGVNVASLALMAVVSFHLARAAFVDLLTAALAAAALLALVRLRINSAWLIAAGAAIGLLAG
jgi:chromate transporter